jgi:hypothetical protein
LVFVALLGACSDDAGDTDAVQSGPAAEDSSDVDDASEAADEPDEPSSGATGVATVVITPDTASEVAGTYEIPVDTCQDNGNVGLYLTGTRPEDNVGFTIRGLADQAGVYVLGPQGESYAGTVDVAVDVADDGVRYEGANVQGQLLNESPLGGTFSIVVDCELE